MIGRDTPFENEWPPLYLYTTRYITLYPRMLMRRAVPASCVRHHHCARSCRSRTTRRAVLPANCNGSGIIYLFNDGALPLGAAARTEWLARAYRIARKVCARARASIAAKWQMWCVIGKLITISIRPSHWAAASMERVREWAGRTWHVLRSMGIYYFFALYRATNTKTMTKCSALENISHRL